MLWQKNEEVEVAEGRTAAVDFRTIAGLSGRLHFAGGFGGHRMTSVHCTVTKVDRYNIVVDLPPDTMLPGVESAVILEVAQQTALVQCFTSVKVKGPDHHLTLRIPSRPHVLQRRRYPRLDLFLSITVLTPEHQVEEVPAQLTNISLDGAACILLEPVAPGDPIQLNLIAIGMSPALVTGTVVRCNPTPGHLWVLGVKFGKLAPEQELFLAQYVSTTTGEQTR